MKINEMNQELRFTVECQDPEVIVRSEGIELHYYRALRRRSPWCAGDMERQEVINLTARRYQEFAGGRSQGVAR